MNEENIVGDWRTVSQCPEQEYHEPRSSPDEHIRFLITVLDSSIGPEAKIDIIAKHIRSTIEDGTYYGVEKKLVEAMNLINLND